MPSGLASKIEPADSLQRIAEAHCVQLMLTLTQTLTDYPTPLLRAIAASRGLDAVAQSALPTSLAAELASALADPG